MTGCVSVYAEYKRLIFPSVDMIEFGGHLKFPLKQGRPLPASLKCENEIFFVVNKATL